MDIYGVEYSLNTSMVDGRPRRTPFDHPYSYDEFIIFDSEIPHTSAVYSDRLYRWDSTKHNRLCLKYFDNVGQCWSERSPEKISDWLSEYYDKKLECVKVIQGCNVSSGHPYWVLFFRDVN